MGVDGAAAPGAAGGNPPPRGGGGAGVNTPVEVAIAETVTSDPLPDCAAADTAVTISAAVAAKKIFFIVAPL